MKKPKAGNKRVVVAMSGGIDSSVAAALLKRAGFDVIGVFMKFWSEPSKDGLVGVWNRCCSPEAEKRARLVSENLGIPFYILNLKKEFKKRIVDCFLKEYKAGLTPNPCVICNKEIKFNLLLKKALSLNADWIATGHYAKIQKRKDGIHLFQGKDKKKDQSYFLWQLNQKQLNHVLFPVGDYTKTQVKNMAKKFKLPVSGISESMEICFIPSTINDFLKRHLKTKSGKIVNTKGKTIGQHQGLVFYTIGQRKGIELSGGPFYVINRDFKKNFLIVSKNEKDLAQKELIVKNVNWISGVVPKLPLKAKVKIRYHHKAASATIEQFNRKAIKVIFDKFQKAITPGQSVVFLKNKEILGGGIIS